ncbi:MAG: ABC transporter ATP-binding protein [Gemmataceae bacterium]|nr:ABC transporter ATP-binding protein [Gemmataceae bacterium]
MIQVRDLRKAFGSLQAVAGVSFDVPQGETFGLLGPNGAGKTTAIHILTGVLQPDAGVIHINGEQDPTQPQVRRHIGLAPQALSLYEMLSAEENLSFFGKLYGLHGTRLRQRVDVALNLARLSERKHDRVGTYSGGMKRRLNLACALVHDPAVVFLDEPTVGVDPQSRNFLFETIEELARQGRTILYTTHYMEEAERLCKRVAIIDNGKILALDTVPNLVAQHGGVSAVEIELDELPGAAATLPGTLEGKVLRFTSDAPQEEPARLAQLGLKFSSFRVLKPNLERVFLNLTGKSLRD